MLEIYAGKQALKALEQDGFNSDLFSNFLGASGGPKWFSLFGLDKYLFGEFFKDRAKPLNLMGSSAGAFRAACFGQADPVAAISRLADNYTHTVYSDKPTAKEITDSGVELLDYVLGSNGIDEIVNNPVFKTHFLVNRARGLVASDNKVLQSLGLLNSFVLNKLDRKLLRHQYQRFVFKPPSSELTIDDHCQFDTHYVNLGQHNLKQSLLASGSIPLVMQGIKDIAGSPKGTYRDGGILDYHFDISIKNSSGLTLYPHFSSSPKAGWFDKNTSRKVLPKHYENTVMLVPSPAFIAALPYAKIPDRSDFTDLSSDVRIKYWNTVLAETEKLADSFDCLLRSEDLSHIKPMP